MILVDTSVWIDHGRRRDARLARWLDEGLVLGHPFVQGELACGQMPNRRLVLTLFDHLPPATHVSHGGVLAFVEDHQLAGRGLGWIDMTLLASAVASRATLATRDARLARAATDLGVAP
jgi:predicted nucleic acid-binding protein